mmetsp:Transcript_87725/g.256423  ORF Transcript_87725/g.256423 Transcript_87725/m.256423 type:complete len:279 (-) Transcript_87725:26-862(-)
MHVRGFPVEGQLDLREQLAIVRLRRVDLEDQVVIPENRNNAVCRADAADCTDKAASAWVRLSVGHDARCAYVEEWLDLIGPWLAGKASGKECRPKHLIYAGKVVLHDHSNGSVRQVHFRPANFVRLDEVVVVPPQEGSLWAASHGGDGVAGKQRWDNGVLRHGLVVEIRSEEVARKGDAIRSKVQAVDLAIAVKGVGRATVAHSVGPSAGLDKVSPYVARHLPFKLELRIGDLLKLLVEPMEKARVVKLGIHKNAQWQEAKPAAELHDAAPSRKCEHK